MFSKRIVYVGGLDPAVTEEVLYAAFIPFGQLREVSIPRDFSENKHRGFGFVDFEEEEDALQAMENMDGAEILGKVIKCDFARPDTKLAPRGKAVWATEEWIQKQQLEGGEALPDAA